jgi:hypothetical protein
VAVLVTAACTRKGDFIDEGAAGTGIHYDPVIISDNLYDTLTGKYLNLTDTTFSSSQHLIFELDFYSQDPVDSFELWAGKSPSKIGRVSALSASAGGYSATKRADTVLFHYTLPDEDNPVKWYIVPRVVTTAGMEAYFQATVLIQ